MPPTHARHDDHPLPERPRYTWSNGTSLAVYIGLNLEHFAFGQGLGAELTPGGPHPDVLNYAWRDYGNRIGAWRLLTLLDQFALPATLLVNTAMYDQAPSLLAAHRARRGEFAGHGRTNSKRQSIFPPDQECALIAECTARMASEEGAPPRGWLSPWIAESVATPDMLVEAGYATRSTGATTSSPSGTAPRMAGCSRSPTRRR
jgi:allantoinase